MRCYIVDGDAITVLDDILQSYWAVVRKDWTIGLAALETKLLMKNEQCTWLEVHCHGDPGILHLHPEVNPDNVMTFITTLQRIMRPGGRIEFLACLVGAFDARELADQLNAAGKSKDDVELLRAWSKDYVELGREFYRWVGSANPDEIVGGLPGRLPANLDHARVARLAISSSQWKLGRYWNGPKFCSRVAQSTLCTVRAAMRKQAEEYELAGKGSPFGRWDGLVFDFLPTGAVEYVGYNVPRPVYFPQDPTGEGATKIT
jgi:hypothetical protein